MGEAHPRWSSFLGATAAGGLVLTTASACSLLLAFPEPTEADAETCVDGRDNDGDGLVDGEDPDCIGFTPEDTPRACTDGEDNDGDGWVDNESPACWGSADLRLERCSSTPSAGFSTGGVETRTYARFIGDRTEVPRPDGVPGVWLVGPSRLRTPETLGAVADTGVVIWQYTDPNAFEGEAVNRFSLYSARDLDAFGQPRVGAPAIVATTTPLGSDGEVQIVVTTPTETVEGRYEATVDQSIALELRFGLAELVDFRLRRGGGSPPGELIGQSLVPRAWAPDEPLVLVWEATSAGALSALFIRRPPFSPCEVFSPALRDGVVELPLAADGVSPFQSDEPLSTCLLASRVTDGATAASPELIPYRGPHLGGPFEAGEPIYRWSSPARHAVAVLPAADQQHRLAFVMERSEDAAGDDSPTATLTILEGEPDCTDWRFRRASMVDLSPVVNQIADLSGGAVPRLRRDAFALQRHPEDGGVEALFVLEQGSIDQVFAAPWAVRATVPDVDADPWTLEDVSFQRLDAASVGRPSPWYRAQFIAGHGALLFERISDGDETISILIESDGRWLDAAVPLLGTSGKSGTFDDVTVGEALLVMDPNRRRNAQWSGTLIYAGGTADSTCEGCRHTGTARVVVRALR
ncbi:MAG TPA: hypothetical protein RMF84_18060 [Polyangiaceae bacterium LLY-WYZ-14_1]|nr:hypothetical protein [Polyangiaceae bacterium LLY-WYZ-14_1]